MRLEGHRLPAAEVQPESVQKRYRVRVPLRHSGASTTEPLTCCLTLQTPGRAQRCRFADAVSWLREPWVLLPGGDHAGTAGGLGAGAGLTVAGSVPESVVNASRLVFQGRADDRD